MIAPSGGVTVIDSITRLEINPFVDSNYILRPSLISQYGSGLIPIPKIAHCMFLGRFRVLQ